MKYQKIILAGGSGYLGKVLAAYYAPLASEIILLSRYPAATEKNIRTQTWDGRTEGNWIESLENADLLVNLCGRSVNCRYNDRNKDEILRSRMLPTTLLGNVIGKLAHPPRLWINIASATIYRHAEDRPQDEETGEAGSGFSVDVCRQWEESFFAAHTPSTRKVLLRMSIVLGRRDGVFPRLINLVKWGLGGKQGMGKQYFSWVHEHDAARCTEWMMDHPELTGIFNCVAPHPLQNSVLMKLIRDTYGIRFGLPAPSWLLEIGALLIGTETELILKSRWVVPKRLLDTGFTFHFSSADHAICDLMSNHK